MTTTSKYVFATLALAVTLAGFAGTNQASAFPKNLPPGTFKCLACVLPKPQPKPQPIYHHPDRWHWGHYWYDWRFLRDRAVYVGGPAVAPVSVAQPVAASSQSCLTKEYLPDGRALFADICTHEEAVSERPTREAK